MCVEFIRIWLLDVLIHYTRQMFHENRKYEKSEECDETKESRIVWRVEKCVKLSEFMKKEWISQKD